MGVWIVCFHFDADRQIFHAAFDSRHLLPNQPVFVAAGCA